MGLSIVHSLHKTFSIPPNRAGWPFIGGGAVVAVVLFVLAGWWGFLPLAFVFFCLFFFRDPARVTPQRDSLVVSPADGIVSAVVRDVSLPAEIADGYDSRFTRISIFLSVLDVHVNRVPVSGDIVRKIYRPGKFFNADLDKASEHNERCSLLIRTARGQAVGVTQIAGLIARRIVNHAAEGQPVRAGARYGIIRFGSRADVYLPAGVAPLVCIGQRMVGAETVLADLDGADEPRLGQVVE